MSGLLFQELESQFTTPIPDSFLADRMPGANGNYVKVYLCAFYGYFHRVRGLTMSKIAKKLHMLESEVLEALSYWHDQGALTLLYDEEADQYRLRFASTDSPEKEPAAPENRTSRTALSKSSTASAPTTPTAPLKDKVSDNETDHHQPTRTITQKVIRVEHDAPNYSADELEVYAKQPLCRDLFQFVTELYGEPLSSVNASKVYSFYDFYRLPIDVIKFMMEHAVKNGHRSLRYIEKIALDWSENNISSVEEAKEYLNRYSLYWPIMRAYHQNGTVPDDSLKEYVERWITEYHMNEDLMVEAAKRTFDQLRKASYPYTNSILENWAKEKVSSVSDLIRLDEEHASSSRSAVSSRNAARTLNNFSNQGDTDYEALEQASLDRFFANYADVRES